MTNKAREEMAERRAAQKQSAINDASIFLGFVKNWLRSEILELRVVRDTDVSMADGRKYATDVHMTRFKPRPKSGARGIATEIQAVLRESASPLICAADRNDKVTFFSNAPIDVEQIMTAASMLSSKCKKQYPALAK